jgi:hypothetical protein
VKLKAFLSERHRKKAHAHYEAERRRQSALQRQDAQEAVRNAVRGAGPGVGTPHNS